MSASKKISIMLTLLLILALLSSAAFAASYSNVYGLTLTRIRVRESASTSGTMFDNIEQNRIVYVTESRDSGGTTFLHVKYRTHEGKTENGWIALSSGGSTFVEILTSEQAQSEYGVSGGDLPKAAAGTKSASERSALRTQNTESSAADSQEKESTVNTAPALNASSATISDVQMKLKALGIYAGDITGRAGDKTISAIKAFQKKIGIEQTGQLTRTTVARLDEAYAALADNGSAAQNDDPAAEGINSEVSSRTIEQVQIMLKALDFYAGDITGNAGEKTAAAVRAFQSQYGLSVDGIIGKATLTKLNNVYAAYQAGDTSVMAKAESSAPEKTSSSSQSASSDTIRQVQEKLKALDFYTGEVTGNTGDKTTAAIKAFQKKYGLTADGIAGSATLKKLDEVYNASRTETSSSTTSTAQNSSASSGTIRQVQEKLKALGFYTGEITGNAGSKTTAAIKAFQKEYGLTADGIAGSATLKKLDEVYSSSGSSAPAKKEEAPASAIASGVSTSTVRRVQQELKDLGFYSGEVTGKAGEKTSAAIRAFQQKYGLTADGILGSDTLTKLDEVYSASKKPAAEETSVPAASSSVSASTIKQVQQKLKDLGFYTGEVTGNTGSKTTAAIKAFQKKYGLTADGVIGSATLNKLDEVYNASQKPAAEETSAPAASSSVSSSTIKQVQQKLKDLGFYTGEVTGNAGSKTTAAIKAFQKKYGLTADGVIGSATLKKLDEVYNASQKPAVEETSAPAASGGVSSSTVKQVQQKLKELGFYTGEVTGNAGSKTIAAVKAFQRKYGLTADGVIGSTTLNKLNEVYEASKKNSSSSSTPSPNSKVSATTVKNVQKQLKELGFYSGEVTGKIGDKTTSAVKAFQKKYGLTVDGILGTSTINKISSVYKASNSPSSSSNSTGKKQIYSLDWFKAKNNKVFSHLGLIKGHSLRLTDLNTGITLSVTIQSASNHLDVEPTTSADTEKFLKIYNVSKPSKITFLRRSGVVTTDMGYRIVCSYYGQPHGSQLIVTNHFNGQFCIHFLNSKTHGSGVVDGDHQACIRQAVAHYGSSNVKIIRSSDDL